jgi:SPP1 family predicted phage head-tail adaptor
MRSARMRHRLTLQYPVITRSATGDTITTWTSDSAVWGAIEPLSGKEYLAASQIQSEISVRIVIRYHANIGPTWRVINDNKVYSILAPLNLDERNRTIELMCSVGVLEQGQIPDDDSGFTVFNSSGQSFSVGRAVLDADGNSFNVI